MFQTLDFRSVDILDGLESLSDLVFLTGSKSVLTFAIAPSTSEIACTDGFSGKGIKPVGQCFKDEAGLGLYEWEWDYYRVNASQLKHV